MGAKVSKGLIFMSFLSIVGCMKDKPAGTNIPVSTTGQNVYVVCEGNFMSGNAELYSYSAGLDSVYGPLYQSINQQPLGDVFQSMTRVGQNFYLCVNNSDKVVVIGASTLKYNSTINIPKPRYTQVVGTSKAYITSEYSKNVYVVNTSNHTITDTIKLPYTNTEGMCQLGNEAYICTWDTACQYISDVDVNTNNIKRSIKIAGSAPQEVLVDKEQMLWVLAGNQPQGKAGTLTRIDPSNGSILASFQFPATADPIKPVFNSTRDTLYFIDADFSGSQQNNGVYRMSIHDAALPATAFVPAQSLQYFWALGIDPASGYVYIGDPQGFSTGKGSVMVYNQAGVLQHKFTVGVGPGHFYFID